MVENKVAPFLSGHGVEMLAILKDIANLRCVIYTVV